MAKLTQAQRWRLWALRSAEKSELIKASIRRRWILPDWDIEYPWWREPSRVRILLYAEGNLITFKDQLMYVNKLLKSRPFPFVNFAVESAHRSSADPCASIASPVALTDSKIDLLNKFDEVWLFGFNESPDLRPQELQLLEDFMKPPRFGGVLVTGDHENRGKSISGCIIRAGQMRKYPGPGTTGPNWNNSLREGPDPNCTYDPEDQSDDVPQTIIPKLFPIISLPGFNIFHRPHPVLCGLEGPIDVLPDHQHEGLALAPIPDPNDAKWPKKNGHQERPVIIASGTIIEPKTSEREFDVLSAYDGHNVDVGRILADASWHHWFDENLLGVPFSDVYKGFDDSPEGEKVLRKIDNFFLNCGVWLAPPARQKEMRLAAWWSILWSLNIAELSPDMPLGDLGTQALAALRRHASPCTASDWVLGDLKPPLIRGELNKLFQHLPALNISLEQLLAGAILKSLMITVGSSNPENDFPLQAPADTILDSLIGFAIETTLSSFNQP